MDTLIWCSMELVGTLHGVPSLIGMNVEPRASKATAKAKGPDLIVMHKYEHLQNSPILVEIQIYLVNMRGN